MRKPDMNKAPKWAKYWLYSPKFRMNGLGDTAYWASSPNWNGIYTFQVDTLTGGPESSNIEGLIWINSHKPNGKVVQVNQQLENK